MTTSPLYETDFYTWTQIQAQALRAKDWAVLDVEHLAEEIESLGRSERFAIERQMERLLCTCSSGAMTRPCGRAVAGD